jgi:hypothetical protein
MLIENRLNNLKPIQNPIKSIFLPTVSHIPQFRDAGGGGSLKDNVFALIITLKWKVTES